MRREYQLAVGLVAVLFLTAAVVPAGSEAERDELKKEGSYYVQVIERSFEVHRGGRLHVEAPNGWIKVKTWDEPKVRVLVERRIKSRHEDEAREVLEDYPTTVLQKGDEIRVETKLDHGWRDSERIEGTYSVTVPRSFNLDLKTAGGSIEVDDLDGDVRAETAGGSIRTGVVSGESDLRTAGGGIAVSGGGTATHAKTAGGDIDIGKSAGDVNVETAGGSITVAEAAGEVGAETAGGSITLGPTGKDVSASTAGGSIRIAASQGSVSASTAGGSIRIDGSGGRVKASTSGGSIEVKNAHGGVSAETSGGSITVELNVAKGDDATSTLKTSGGDVTIYIPDDLAVTIDAEIRRTKGRHVIQSDFPIEAEYSNGNARAKAEMSGGGDKIHLRTAEGDIRIKKLKR
jgi:DUF4097 and DUF4098 domain-containing protein YvlB